MLRSSFERRHVLSKLKFRADKSKGPIKTQLCRQLMSDARRSGDADLLGRVVVDMGMECLNTLGNDVPRPEQLDEIRQNNSRRLDKLETDLARAKLASNRESIRLAHMEVAEFMAQTGRSSDAVKLLVKNREHCTLPLHNAELQLTLVSVLIDMGDYKQAQANLIRAESIVELENDEMFTGNVCIFRAIIALADLRYKEVAQTLLRIKGDGKFIEALLERSAHILSIDEICCLIAVTAAATFDRKSLREMLENRQNRLLLERSPAMHALLTNLHKKSYLEAFTAIECLRTELCLDVFLEPHMVTLTRLTIERAVLEHLLPYESANLDTMDQAFGLSLRTTVVALIRRGELNARIDGHSNLLVKVRSAPQLSAMHKIASLARSHGRTIRKGLLRLSYVEHGLVAAINEQQLSLVGGVMEEGTTLAMEVEEHSDDSA